MFDPYLVVAVFCVYAGALFLVALKVERDAQAGKNWSNNPYVYTLSLAVYCTAWTYYGSVGKAANSGMLFLTIYLGPTMAITLWWIILRKLVRIKNSRRITSIADLISSRYGKSQTLAVIATLLALVGVTPYIALQLKAIISTFRLITAIDSAPSSWMVQNVGSLLVILMVLFTIILGIRRIDPTERHPGIVMAVATESVVKLIAFMAVGIFVTYFMYDGFGDIFQKLSESSYRDLLATNGPGASSYTLWVSYLLLAMSAVVFLPRQFHLSVVENFEEKHIRTAMWMFPLYMLLINIFVIPIVVGGLLAGYGPAQADAFVLQLPLDSGLRVLSLLVFLGGFSAATSMILISAMTLSTMVTNHLLLPLILWFPALVFLRRYLLQCRWAAAAIGIATGYLFAQTVGETYLLVNMGIMSFAAVMQFAPPILGGLFWRRGNKAGALTGLSCGFLMWGYTMLAPAFVKSGWLPQALLDQGPWGIGFLAPEHLFGLTALDPISNTVFWTMFVNVGGYVLGSYLSEPSQEEERMTQEFMGRADGYGAPPAGVQVLTVDLQEKRLLLEKILGQYFPKVQAASIIHSCLNQAGIGAHENISIVELAELTNQAERTLSGSIGSAAAHLALKVQSVFSPSESKALAAAYADMLANLRVTPEELKDKVDYYQERETLLQAQAREMSAKVVELEMEVTERKRAELALKMSEERWQGIVDNAAVGISQITEEGRLVMANPRLAQLLGYDSPEDLMSSVSNVMDLYVDPGTRRQVLDQLNTQRELDGFEARFRRKDGKIVWVSMGGRAVKSTAAQIVFEGFLVDITARKRAEKETRKLQGKLAQAQKMEAIGTLAGGIAHDFNNILSAVIGYTELSLIKSRSGGDATKYLEKILTAGERAGDLVKQILSFSRQAKQERRFIDLAPVTKEALKLLRASLPATIEMRQDVRKGQGSVFADPTQMHQVLMNLCTNASHAMQEQGGVLEVSLNREVIDQATASQYAELEPGTYQVLSVSDTGKGIDETILDRIFEPFFTTKDKGEGTGMGLSVVHGIVKAHDGVITAYSEPDVGSTFRVYLPLQDSQAQIDEQQDDEFALYKGRERILLVDDEPDLLDIGEEILELLGYSVTTQSSSLAALDLFKADSEAFDLVITDQTMPRMTGMGLARELLKINPELPIILCTGFSVQISLERVKQAGIKKLVMKPFTGGKLAQAIREVLDGDSEG